jgi:hypothetical protein
MADAGGPGAQQIECGGANHKITGLAGLPSDQDAAKKSYVAMATSGETPWIVDIKLRTQYISLEPQGGLESSLTRIDNAGQMILSYLSTVENALTISTFSGGYFIKSKRDITKPIFLKAQPEFTSDLYSLAKPSVTSVTKIELMLGKPSKDWTAIIPGLKLKWKIEALFHIVITQNHDGKPISRVSDPAVEVQLGSKYSISNIFIAPNTGLISLKYADPSLDKQLKAMHVV